jgi:hypothetical protein
MGKVHKHAAAKRDLLSISYTCGRFVVFDISHNRCRLIATKTITPFLMLPLLRSFAR